MILLNYLKSSQKITFYFFFVLEELPLLLEPEEVLDVVELRVVLPDEPDVLGLYVVPLDLPEEPDRPLEAGGEYVFVVLDLRTPEDDLDFVLVLDLVLVTLGTDFVVRGLVVTPDRLVDGFVLAFDRILSGVLVNLP